MKQGLLEFVYKWVLLEFLLIEMRSLVEFSSPSLFPGHEMFIFGSYLETVYSSVIPTNLVFINNDMKEIFGY